MALARIHEFLVGCPATGDQGDGGCGNRARIASLDGWSFTTKLYPQNKNLRLFQGIVLPVVLHGGYEAAPDCHDNLTVIRNR